MNQWCSIKVTKVLEKLEEGAVGDGVGATAGWTLGGCPEARDCLSAYSCTELQAEVCQLWAGECFPLPASPSLSLVD